MFPGFMGSSWTRFPAPLFVACCVDDFHSFVWLWPIFHISHCPPDASKADMPIQIWGKVLTCALDDRTVGAGMALVVSRRLMA